MFYGDILKTVGGSRWLEASLCLTVSRPVQRVDVVCPVGPKITPQRVSPLSQSAEISPGSQDTRSASVVAVTTNLRAVKEKKVMATAGVNLTPAPSFPTGCCQ